MKSISQAFVNFQGEVKPIGKTKRVVSNKYSYTYAELSDIANAIQPTLHKHGLAWRQVTETTADMVSVQTLLIHATDKDVWDCGTVSMPIVDKNPQKIATLLTYCRRYSLVNGLSLTVIDEDTDAIDHTPDVEEKTIHSIRKENNSENKGKSVIDTGLLCKQREKAQIHLMTFCRKNSINDLVRKEIIRRETGKTSATQLNIDELRRVYRVIQSTLNPKLKNTGG